MPYEPYVRNITHAPAIMLARRCKPVHKDEVNNVLFQQIVADMFHTMMHAGGIGLAANQIGIPKALFVMKGDVCAINPFVAAFGDEFESKEGCLSWPGAPDRVVLRKPHCFLKARDLNWKEYTLELHGEQAVCAQHEFDHLQGLTIAEKEIVRERSGDGPEGPSTRSGTG